MRQSQKTPAQHRKQIFTHMLVGALLLLLMVACFILGLLAMKTQMQEVNYLQAIEPENRTHLLEKKIADTRKRVEEQYAAHKSKMDDASIFVVNKKFATLYQATEESSRDYGESLSQYRKALYEVASKTRGSGEWFFYHNQRLQKLEAAQSKQHAALQSYIQKTASESMTEPHLEKP